MPTPFRNTEGIRTGRSAKRARLRFTRGRRRCDADIFYSPSLFSLSTHIIYAALLIYFSQSILSFPRALYSANTITLYRFLIYVGMLSDYLIYFLHKARDI